MRQDETEIRETCNLPSLANSRSDLQEMVLIYSDTTLTEKIAILKTALDKAEALIIGAGSGLSRTRYAREAAGLDYDNADTFNALFPGYHDRYCSVQYILTQWYFYDILPHMKTETYPVITKAKAAYSNWFGQNTSTLKSL
jgi:hypothetical protein